MSKMKVGIIGSGGRSRLYIDALKRLPDDFELAMMRFRTEEKAQRFKEEYGIPVTTSVEELKAVKPDFIVDVVNRPDVGKVAVEFLEAGIPILAETPAAESPEEILYMWDLVQRTGTKMLVAENYFAEPYFAAVIEICRRGYLGEVQTITVSNTHEYHAASMIRMILGKEYAPFTAIGRILGTDLTVLRANETGEQTEQVVPAERYHVLLNYEDGKTGIYDFAIPNYWSQIRQNRFLVQGPRGEIKDNTVVFMDKDSKVQRMEITQNKDAEGRLVNITLGDDVVYENDLLKTKGVGGNLGICHMLLNMKHYIETGECPYSLASAMQDAHYTQKFLECGRKPLTLVHSETMPWS